RRLGEGKQPFDVAHGRRHGALGRSTQEPAVYERSFPAANAGGSQGASRDAKGQNRRGHADDTPSRSARISKNKSAAGVRFNSCRSTAVRAASSNACLENCLAAST